MDFPRLDDTTFPHLNTVDVYKFKNEVDYSRFDNIQMIIHVMNVPWDLGEVHVGNRTVSGIGNVVKFENDSERDSWFDSKSYYEIDEAGIAPELAREVSSSSNYDGFKWATQYREYHHDDEINLPLPFDVMARYNYCWIEYQPAPTAEYTVNYEQNGILRWFYFVRNFEMVGVNNTTAIIKRDTWQTYINRIKFAGVWLEQGHLPIAQTSVEKYLQNPIENNDGLLCEDVSFGEISRVSHSSAVVLNDSEMVAVIVSGGNPQTAWGSKSGGDWKTPDGYRAQDGQPSYNAFCIATNQLSTFISNCNSSAPQFVQTIKCVFFISKKLVSIGTEFEFCSITCSRLNQKNSTLELVKLAKNQFGYDSKYAHLAKLYTFPYAALEVTDENGGVSLIKIEDTSGTLTLQTSIGIAYPWLNIQAFIGGVGGSVSKNLTFRNVSNHTFSTSGRWYEYLMAWNIPTFAVTQSASTHNDYATHFERLQERYAANQANSNALDTNATNYNDAIDSNNTAYTNAVASNNTAKTNADTSADISVTNQGIQATANSAATSSGNTSITNATQADNALNNLTCSLSNSVTLETVNNEVDAANAGAAISAIGSIAGGAVSGAASGAAMGPPGIAAGAAMGIVTSSIGSITNIAQTAVSNNLKTSQASLQTDANSNQTAYANANAVVKTGYQRIVSVETTDINNDSAISQTANNAGVIKANATRTRDTGNANATRDKDTGNAIAARDKSNADTVANRDLDTAISAINNQIKQAALEAPFEFGNFTSGETSTTRPQAAVANIVTQSRDAISRAGDYFLRYGYRYEKFVELETFNVMPKFSYWKCSDIWVDGLDVADEQMDEIRFFLLGGVTVWRRPEYIGKTSIYENI